MTMISRRSQEAARKEQAMVDLMMRTMAMVMVVVEAVEEAVTAADSARLRVVG